MSNTTQNHFWVQAIKLGHYSIDEINPILNFVSFVA